LDEWQAEHTNGAIIFNKTQLLSDTLLEADKVRGKLHLLIFCLFCALSKKSSSLDRYHGGLSQ